MSYLQICALASRLCCITKVPAAVPTEQRWRGTSSRRYLPVGGVCGIPPATRAWKNSIIIIVFISVSKASFDHIHSTIRQKKILLAKHQEVHHGKPLETNTSDREASGWVALRGGSHLRGAPRFNVRRRDRKRIRAALSSFPAQQRQLLAAEAVLHLLPRLLVIPQAHSTTHHRVPPSSSPLTAPWEHWGGRWGG